MQKNRRRIAVIGAGASGCMAAIFAAKQNTLVTVFEQNDRIGKKILATGNGKCNLANTNLSPEAYVSESAAKESFLQKAFSQYGVDEVLGIFHEMGLLTTTNREEYVYPASLQASSVQDLLRFHLEQECIVLRTGQQVLDVKKQKDSFQIISRNAKTQDLQTEEYDRVIFAAGGCAGPKTGSDGKLIPLIKKLGHTVVPMCPGLVQLKCTGAEFKAMSGVRCDAVVTLEGIARHADGMMDASERGELQLTDYGISGFPVFQLSLGACRQLHQHKTIEGKIDFLPDLTKEQLIEELLRRHTHYEKLDPQNAVEQVTNGLINKKVMLVLLKRCHLRLEKRLLELAATEKQLHRLYDELASEIKSMKFIVTGDNGFENAQVSTGGVAIEELNEKMESRLIPGLFFTGEIIDVTGKCGGYNLQWAWTSGILAGQGAVE